MGNLFLALGIFIGLSALFLIYVFIKNGKSGPLIIAIAFLAMTFAFSFLGIDYRKGENSKYVKRRPNILDLADSFSNTVFENDFVVISDKALVNKKRCHNIVALEDVFAIYEDITRINGITTSHTIQICAIDGHGMQINVYARKRETIDDLLLAVSHFCPNAKVGY